MSLVKGKFFDPSDPLNGSQVKLDNDQALVGKKVDGTDQDIIKVNADDVLELASVPVVPAGADPASDDALARKAYVDGAASAAASSKLDLSGGTMAGSINMNANFITNLPAPGSAGDAAPKAYVDDSVLALSGVVQGNFDLQQSDIDGLRSDVDALTLNKQDSLGTGTTAQYLRGDLTWQDLPASASGIVYVQEQANLPVPGDELALYGTQEDNRLWRYASIPSPLVPDFTVGIGQDFETLADALAAPEVVDGTVLGVEAGTFVLTSTLVIDKQVKIVGAGMGYTFLETAGTSSDPVTMISVTADNVFLSEMRISHKKTSNTSVEAAVVVSRGAFPTFDPVNNFQMYQVRVEHCEFGVVIRGADWTIDSCILSYGTGAVGNSNRCIGIYGSQGDCFITNNVFDNSVLSGTAFRAIYSTSTNNTSNELLAGNLIISGNTQIGPLQQFYLQDNLRGIDGQSDVYGLYILQNQINETSLFAGMYLTASNQADVFTEIILENNEISNNHDPATGTGKGLLAIDGLGTALDYRSSPLPIHATGNVLGQTTFRSDYTEAIGSTGALVGYKNTVFNPATVAVDSTIPVTPLPIPRPGGTISEYVEVSPALVEDQLNPGETNKAPSQAAVSDALNLKQDYLGMGTTSQYLRGDLQWAPIPAASVPKKEGWTLSATDITNGYVDCSFLAVADSMRVLSGGVEHIESESYTLSEVSGVTRITFIGDLVSGPSALVEGDKVYVQYLK